MRFGICLLVPLLLTLRVHSFSEPDPGSGAGPVPTRGSTITQQSEGSGAGGLPDDEDSRPSSTVVTTTTTTAGATSAAAATITVTSSTSRSISQGTEQEQGSGAGTVRLSCDSSKQCFCIDENNREIPNTRGRTSCTPVDEEIIVPKVAVPYDGSNLSPSSASPAVASSAAPAVAEGVNEEIDIDATPTSNPPPVNQSSPSPVGALTTQTTTAATSTPSTTTRTTPTTTASPTTAAPTSTRAPATKSLAVVRQTAPSTAKAVHVPSTVTTTLSNVIPVDVTVLPAGPSDDNSIGEAVPLSGGPNGDGDGSLHPGLLAAIIGGGVVGLLCAILLIMFIVYRMRKKDEGSYPLDDGKPRMAYAAKSSANKEFYA